MRIPDLQIRPVVPMHAAFAELERQAKLADPGRSGEIASAFERLFRATEGNITLRVPGMTMLAQVADMFRAQGNDKAVAALEDAIRAIAGPTRQPVIQGTFNVHTTPRELESTIDQVKHRLLDKLGG